MSYTTLSEMKMRSIHSGPRLFSLSSTSSPHIQSELLNTHYYDGKITIKPPSYPMMSPSDKKSILESFLHSIRECLSPQATHYMSMIISDIGTPKNHCLANEMYAEDVLIAIYEIIRHDTEKIKNTCSRLSEQLSDISSGECPAGRNLRLYQIWFSLT
jgi:hypothetical protein